MGSLFGEDSHLDNTAQSNHDRAKMEAYESFTRITKFTECIENVNVLYAILLKSGLVGRAKEVSPNRNPNPNPNPNPEPRTRTLNTNPTYVMLSYDKS